MQKKLPITINTGFTTECWTFLRLAAILSDSKNIPWFIENFNNYFVDETYDVLYYEWSSREFLCIYDEILQFEDISDKKDIVGAVIDAINQDGYVVLYCDRFYIKGSPHYQKEHYPHDLLIYGYDNDSKVFNFIDINIDGCLWGEHTISYDIIKHAFESMLEIFTIDFDRWTWIYRTKLPASVFYLNKHFNRKPRLDIFYEEICNCLSGGETLERVNNNGKMGYRLKRFGVSSYRSYYEDLINTISNSDKNYLGKEENKHVLYKMKSLIENKYNLEFKLKYLNENNLTNFPENIFLNIKNLCELLESAFYSSTKYSFTLDKALLSIVRENFIDAEKLEINILQEIKKCLTVYMNKRLT